MGSKRRLFRFIVFYALSIDFIHNVKIKAKVYFIFHLTKFTTPGLIYRHEMVILAFSLKIPSAKHFQPQHKKLCWSFCKLKVGQAIRLAANTN